MADRLSALAHLPRDEDAEGAVRLSEVRAASILQIQAWPDTAEAVRSAVADILSFGAPAPGAAAVGDGVTVAAVAPGRYFVAGAADGLAERFAAALTSDDAAVTDFSHGRSILRIEGEAAAEVLATGVMIDLDPAAFPPGRVAQTMIHHIDVLIHRRSATAFDLWVLRSFAEALAEWLLDAGAPGIRFTSPPS